ncbi:MAG: MBL fold metallo-hydrolase [Jiangellaceae bacterium]|nr:MBL fold metallo-hydrolase [Jiangellaceae bacterium]
MKLTVIGCSGSVPGPDSPASSYLVEADGFRVLLDLGNGALGVLQRHADLTSIDGVMLSHLHADHCLDLCPMFVALRYGPGNRRDQRIPVWGPLGTEERMALAYGAPEEPGMSQQFDYRKLADTVEAGPFQVRAVTVDHPVPAYAIRLEHAGRVLAYSGDTGPTPALVDVASGADVFICEAALSDDEEHPPGLHLTGREAGETARAAGVGRLVITHVPPWHDVATTVKAAGTAYEGPVTAARSGLVLDV